MFLPTPSSGEKKADCLFSVEVDMNQIRISSLGFLVLLITMNSSGIMRLLVSLKADRILGLLYKVVLVT